jgi:hypothetical protein
MGFAVDRSSGVKEKLHQRCSTAWLVVHARYVLGGFILHGLLLSRLNFDSSND